jgi:outer membrane murein-binding lipoprotein Lpp
MKNPRISLVFAALVLVLVAAGCSKNPAPRTDQAITSDIQAKLFQDSVLKARDIGVATQDAVVTLTGTVNTDQEKASAEQIASHVGGVKQVVDQLSVPSATAAASTAPPPPVPAQKSQGSTTRAEKRHGSRGARAALPAEASVEPVADTRPPAQPATAPVVNQPPPQPAAPPTVTIPAGTTVNVRMVDGVDSATAQPGQTFAASLATPLVVGNTVAIPAGSDVSVRLVTASSSGRLRGSAQLGLQLHSLTVNGTRYNVTSDLYTATGASRGKQTAEAVGGAGAIGGLIGAIAGGGKGAAIGAGIGAATGGGVQAARKQGQVKVPAEAKIAFALAAPLTVEVSQ